jgi:hypothetical protein
MGEFAESTLWRVSAFERARSAGPATVPSTLLAELRRLQADPHEDDLLSVVAACVRHRASVLLCFEHGPWLWPVTLFPELRLYHSPRDLADLETLAALSRLRLIAAERPEVQPPPPSAQAAAAVDGKFKPLAPLLGALSLYGPRATLLSEIGGRAAYRLTPGRAQELPETPGALGPAVQRLRTEAVSLREMSRWPGMSLERASRLLNALYLSGSLMVTRSHAAARDEPTPWRGTLGRKH